MFLFTEMFTTLQTDIALRQLSTYMCPNCQASIEGFDAFTAHFASCSQAQQ